MKIDRLNKFYDRLSNKERGWLWFQNIVALNEIEMNRVTDSAPKRTYTCPDLEYQEWRDGFWRLACYYGIEFWKVKCRATSCLALVFMKYRQDDLDGVDEYLEMHSKEEGVLLALDMALDEFCFTHKIAPNPIREHAGTENHQERDSRWDFKPDIEAKEAYRDTLFKLIPQD